MTSYKTPVPAVDGWFTVDGRPHLLGTKCASCATYFFPKETLRCRNPHCQGAELEEVRLSRTGKVWSYTVNHYAPPPPYVAADPFEPYAIAAVELSAEQMVVLGQVSGAADPDRLAVGAEVELVVEPFYEDDDHQYLVWKWRPVDR